MHFIEEVLDVQPYRLTLTFITGETSIGSTEQLPLSLPNDFLYCPRRAALKLIEGGREACRFAKPRAGNCGRFELRTSCMSTKDILLEVARKLPPDATLVDAIYELEFRQAVEEGLASLDRGERTPLEDARKRIPQWTSKYSSPTKP